jgi:hypothetical protein
LAVRLVRRRITSSARFGSQTCWQSTSSGAARPSARSFWPSPQTVASSGHARLSKAPLAEPACAMSTAATSKLTYRLRSFPLAARVAAMAVSYPGLWWQSPTRSGVGQWADAQLTGFLTVQRPCRPIDLIETWLSSVGAMTSMKGEKEIRVHGQRSIPTTVNRDEDQHHEKRRLAYTGRTDNTAPQPRNRLFPLRPLVAPHRLPLRAPTE